MYYDFVFKLFDQQTRFNNITAYQSLMDLTRIYQAYWSGVYKYTGEFTLPFWTALNAFLTTEKDKLVRHRPEDSIKDYLELLKFNLQVAEKGLVSSLETMGDYHASKASQWFAAGLNTFEQAEGETIQELLTREADLLEKVVYTYPKAIREIKTEYGFNFNAHGYIKKAETDRFELYQVLPSNGSTPRKTGKPILIIPPYVLGANILAFLPGENKSYVHAYADQGIPTYIRIIKDISTTPAVQTMSGEADTLDMRDFCELLQQEYGQAVTLNGFCQGGFVALAGILTGELDGLVDALITCVAPMDGTRSAALIEYLQHLPQRFRDLGYALKLLPSGNMVVDGKVMSWVYKLKSMETEAPLHTFYRDLKMFGAGKNQDLKISKTAAAINNWLIYDRNDLPESITKMSFDSYTIPITEDGTLPIQLFGRKLNLHRLKEKKLPLLLCYGRDDDLVDKDAALAPLDFVDAEVTCFPKGHGAIATSWSHPDSEYALHKRFADGSRGPVRFQLDLQQSKSIKK
jgi:alpha-beta hydrolase superfamily lysophospholipase